METLSQQAGDICCKGRFEWLRSYLRVPVLLEPFQTRIRLDMEQEHRRKNRQTRVCQV